MGFFDCSFFPEGDISNGPKRENGRLETPLLKKKKKKGAKYELTIIVNKHKTGSLFQNFAAASVVSRIDFDIIEPRFVDRAY